MNPILMVLINAGFFSVMYAVCRNFEITLFATAIINPGMIVYLLVK